jgi:hypothetical protein
MALGGNVIACIFFLKCQGGWRELQQLDVSVVDAEQQQVEARREQLRLLRAMTPEELQTIRESKRQVGEIMDLARHRLTETSRRKEEHS